MSGDDDRSTRSGLDAYEIRARFAPAVASVVPIVTMLLVGFGIDGKWVTALLTASVPVVVAVVVTSLSREAGRSVQERLWGPDGVSPVVEMLRWRTGPSRAETRERHEIVRMATGTELPDEATELADPREADGHYRIAEDELRRVVAKGDHPALRRSMIQYGFVRNLRGLRPVCLASTAVAAVVGVWIAASDGERLVAGLAIVAVALACAAIVWWLIDDGAVRSSGDTYARALFDACSDA